MITRGTFGIEATPGPPFDTDEGVVLGRMTFSKQFSGPLDAAGTVHMTYARAPEDSSAGYVAVEKITGALEGRKGSFVVMHTGVTHGGDLSLTVAIVPNSGTGELAGISGTMTLDNTESGHEYALDYQLA